MQNKITPSLWFSAISNDISEIVDYYKTVFGTAFVVDKTMDLGETPSGQAQLAHVSLFGQKYTFMRTEADHAHFNDSMSLTVQCDDQAEIDLFWNYFTKEGKEVQCGWCHDKYGMRWQVIPKNLEELLNRPNGWNVMMGQVKIVIGEYLQ